jgi:hypothetical protein
MALMMSKLYAALRLAVHGMMPKPPLLDSNKIHELELRGVDSMRALLSRHDVGMQRNDGIRLDGNVVFVERGEIEDWLQRKAAQDALWIKVGVVAAILAAVFSLGALLK